MIDTQEDSLNKEKETGDSQLNNLNKAKEELSSKVEQGLPPDPSPPASSPPTVSPLFSSPSQDSSAISAGKEIIEESIGEELEEVKPGGHEARMKKEIRIITMPKKFRQAGAKSGKAKTIGIIIMIGGVVLVIGVSLVLYFYLIKPTDEDKPTEADNIISNGPEAKENSNESQNQASNEGNNQERPENQENSNGEQAGRLVPGIEDEDPSAELRAGDEEETSMATTTEETEATSTPPVETSQDSDNDGLNNEEEELLGSNINVRDSDNDGYSDLNELMNLYNPIGSGQLLENPNIKKYTNGTYSYSVLYPLGWSRSQVAGDDSIIFKSQDKHFIQIITQANSAKQTIQNWYKEQFATDYVDPDNIIIVNDWWGIKNNTGLIVYITDSQREHIFVLSYTSDPDSSMNYKNIFEMMVKSFVIGN